MVSGQVAGLVITKPGGDPTTGATMRLRGTTSLLGGNGPLVVIDGVPGASMNIISPEDVESISVLKDASAAAIYGARSANGVIIITTKKGREGQRVFLITVILVLKILQIIWICYLLNNGGHMLKRII